MLALLGLILGGWAAGSLLVPHIAFDAGANETDAGGVKKIRGRLPFCTVWFDQRDAKHAVMSQGVL